MGLDLGATQTLFWLCHPSPGSQDRCAFVSLPHLHLPQAIPHTGYQNVLIHSSDPVLLLLKNFPCSSSPTE